MISPILLVLGMIFDSYMDQHLKGDLKMLNEKWNMNGFFPTLNELEKVVDDFIGDFDFIKTKDYNQAFHIQDNGDNTKIYFNVPGIKKHEINVTLEGKLLTVEFPKKKWYDPKAAENSKISFKIGSQVKTEEMGCKLEDGVLIISFDKCMDKKDSKKTIAID